MAPRTLLRYDQIRQNSAIGNNADDSHFADGRYFRANCQPTDAINNCVYITGNTLDVPDVTTVDVFDLTKMPAIGIIIEKESMTECLVQVLGLFNTLSGVIIGHRYFIDGAGFPSPAMPVPAPGGIAVVQVVGYGYDDDTILISTELNPTVRTNL